MGVQQVPAFLEAFSQFLDEGRVPSKALLLFGPNRTGKSTALRIAKELVGNKVSAVSLQQLADGQGGGGFAVAELFGRALNVCPDLPKDHIPDLSAFKRVTGDDPITASKKYGAMLTFRANSQFMLSANTLPTVPAAEGTSYLSSIGRSASSSLGTPVISVLRLSSTLCIRRSSPSSTPSNKP
ncbi:DUF5906 domain-containing protein [Mycobacteroides abscessus]|uniref:DUF5906 domain-containing protein n=1 Tax=Mycobacteroides abscessus TaxID=36809 RepID=UPI000F61E43F|nr:DUF5906 domain-containing protein [Mycobacteroides abscessus]